MNYIDKLCSMTNPGRKGGKEFLLDYFSKHGDPHKRLRVIHVAGTCGKGSTTAMIANGLKAAGFKVGMFTSPHLLKLNERIQINGISISDERLNTLIEKYMVQLPDLTFSEYLVLVMMDYFVSEGVDYLVCECFVGGMNDPTNIFDSIVTVLTSVGLDHVGLIGKDIREILLDKLGIMRKGIPLFTRLDSTTIGFQARREGAQYVKVMKLVDTNLHGEFQRENAGLAFEVLRYLGIDERIIVNSLHEVEWHGRCEFVRNNILVDCAHNGLGTEALMNYVNSLQKGKKYCLFAMSKNKKFSDFEAQLRSFDEVVFTKPSVFKIEDPKKYTKGKMIGDVEKALEYLTPKLEENDLLVVCGSVFLAAQALEILK